MADDKTLDLLLRKARSHESRGKLRPAGKGLAPRDPRLTFEETSRIL